VCGISEEDSGFQGRNERRNYRAELESGIWNSGTGFQSYGTGYGTELWYGIAEWSMELNCGERCGVPGFRDGGVESKYGI
jgi:hypothetical protein